MAKHHDRHLAVEQLSAFLDKQLSPEEQAHCEAHLQRCQQCQNALLGLRQTVAFVQALPQPELPRSFTLPTGVTYLQERPEREPTPNLHQSERRRSLLPSLRRATRVISTIAAVIGLFFLLSTVLSFSHLSGGASTTSTTSAPYTSAGGTLNITPTPRVKGATPHNQTASPSTELSKTPTVASATPAIEPRPSLVQNQPSLLAFPDISTSLGRQEIGVILLALAILGFLLTRNWRPKQRKLENKLE